MDIASLSMTLSQNNLMNDVSVSMLSKSLDMTSTLSENITDMIDSTPAASVAVNGVGGNIDITI